MVKKLEYPIDRIHQNLALRKDKVVVAYYRIPNTPITITDSDKKDSHKTKVAQVIKKLAKYKNFDISLIDFLRNKIWYNSSMNYEASKQLTDVRFKRLVGVQRTTFEEMLAVLKTAYQRKHAKGGRTPKLSLEDLLMATLQYMREYRTYDKLRLILAFTKAT
ncbi:IS1381A transposase [Streptococcus agalactiae]|nr:IS1381A transposase [Streptococcus agalactiae]